MAIITEKNIDERVLLHSCESCYIPDTTYHLTNSCRSMVEAPQSLGLHLIWWGCVYLSTTVCVCSCVCVCACVCVCRLVFLVEIAAHVGVQLYRYLIVR